MTTVYDPKITTKKGIMAILWAILGFLVVYILPFLSSLPNEAKTGIVVLIIGILTAVSNYMKNKDK